MSKRVAVGASSFGVENETPLRLLEEQGLKASLNPFGRKLTEQEIIAHLEGAVGLLAGLEPLNRRVLTSCPGLKAIARIGIGMDNVDSEAARDLGIKVSNTPDGPTQAVAEMTLAALLCLCRKLIPANKHLHQGKWVKKMGAGLGGTKVLIIGFGRIGRRLAGLLRPFGSEILVTDPWVSKDETPDCQFVALEEGLRQADVITLHANSTETILGPSEFSLIKEGALLLNGARGHLVDEAALLDALESGKLEGVWLDAFWEEPYSGVLTNYEQVLLTPHIGSYTRQCRVSMEIAAVRNLLRDLGRLR